jgi:hypothetical protein
MKMSPRRAAMQSIRVLGVNDYKSIQEMEKAKELYDLMKLNDQAEEPVKKPRKRRRSAELTDTEKAAK